MLLLTVLLLWRFKCYNKEIFGAEFCIERHLAKYLVLVGTSTYFNVLCLTFSKQFSELFINASHLAKAKLMYACIAPHTQARELHCIALNFRMTKNNTIKLLLAIIGGSE